MIKLVKERELNSWKGNHVYEKVDGRRDMNIVNTKRIIKEKEGEEIWKARLVAKGFTKKLGKKKNECEAPTCSTNGLKMVLMVIKTFGWNVKILDIKMAYL